MWLIVYLPREATYTATYVVVLSVCLSVCPSRSSIVWKWLNLTRFASKPTRHCVPCKLRRPTVIKLRLVLQHSWRYFLRTCCIYSASDIHRDVHLDERRWCHIVTSRMEDWQQTAAVPASATDVRLPSSSSTTVLTKTMWKKINQNESGMDRRSNRRTDSIATRISTLARDNRRHKQTK